MNFIPHQLTPHSFKIMKKIFWGAGLIHRAPIKRVGFALCSLIFTTGAVDAKPQNESSASPNPPQQKIEIRNVTANYDHRHEDVTTKLIVTKEDIEKFGDSSLLDVLKRQSGIVVNGSEIKMRGLGNGYTQILVDGERMATGFTIESVNPDQVERIEILRSASADMSTQAIAGTINIILKRKAISQQRDIKLSFDRRGPFTLLKNARFQVADKIGDFSYNVNGTILGGYFGGVNERTLLVQDANDGTTITRTTLNPVRTTLPALNINPRFTWILENGDAITLKTSYFHQLVKRRSELDWHTQTGAEFTYPKENSASDDDRLGVGMDVNWEHKFSGEAKLTSTLGAHRFRYTNTRNDRGENLKLLISENQPTRFSNNLTTWKFLGNLSVPISEFHAFKAGWDLIQKESALTRDANFNIFDSSQARLRGFAFFAQNEWKTTENWSNYYGARSESFVTEGSGSIVTPFHNKTYVVSPILQSLWKPNGSKENQVRFAVAKTFKNPDFFDLIPNLVRQFNNGTSSPDNASNTQLKPEVALGLDLAYEHFGNDGINASISMYHRKVRDLIRQDLRQVHGRWVALQINDGNAQINGLEFDIKMPLSALISTLKKMEIRTNLTRNWSSVDKVPGSNNRLAEHTKLSGSLGIDYTLNDEWAMGASYVFNSGGFYQISTTTASQASAKRILDSYLFWRVNKDCKVRLSLGNLLAQTQIDKSFYIDHASSEISQNTQSSHRKIGLSIETKF